MVRLRVDVNVLLTVTINPRIYDFQFQYGAVKRRKFYTPIWCETITPFNSNMVRLRVAGLDTNLQEQITFNSNMVRLRGYGTR